MDLKSKTIEIGENEKNTYLFIYETLKYLKHNSKKLPIKKENLSLLCKKEKKLLDIVLNLLKETPSLLTIQDENGYTLGMHALFCEIPVIALKCLHFPQSRVLKTESGLNIGMLAAKLNFEDIVLEALDYTDISIQTNNDGRNLGMFAAYYGLEKSVLKATENKLAVSQFDRYKENLVTYAAKAGLIIAVEKALRIPEIRHMQADKNYSVIDKVAMHGMINQASIYIDKDRANLLSKQKLNLGKDF